MPRIRRGPGYGLANARVRGPPAAPQQPPAACLSVRRVLDRDYWANGCYQPDLGPDGEEPSRAERKASSGCLRDLSLRLAQPSGRGPRPAVAAIPGAE